MQRKKPASALAPLAVPSRTLRHCGFRAETSSAAHHWDRAESSVMLALSPANEARAAGSAVIATSVACRAPKSCRKTGCASACSQNLGSLKPKGCRMLK